MSVVRINPFNNMPGVATTATTTAGLLLTTLLTLQGENDDQPLPVVTVNADGGILGDDDETCSVYGFDIMFQSDFCSAFVTSRTSRSIFSIAQTRAMNCMASAETECVLSPEVGFAVPVAYISMRGDVGVQSIIAPKILNAFDPAMIRVSSPIDPLTSRRAELNSTIDVEYLNIQKSIERATFSGHDAFCIQLLLNVFSRDCVNLLK